MTIKKMLLLAAMALAAVAFMAPAMAQADEWYTDTPSGDETIGIGTNNADEVEFTGFLTSTILGGAVASGPCLTHVVADVWNEKFAGGVVTGTGEVTLLEITTPCDVTINGTTLPTGTCQINEARANTEVPWHINVLAETKLDIEGANFTNFYSAGCAEFGLPAEGSASGTATGQAVHRTKETCIVFNKSGDLGAALGTVTIDGEVCAPNLTLK